MVGLLRKVHREQRGQALVETALAVPLLLLLIVGMVDFGRAYNYANDLTHLANEAARFATVNNCGTGCPNIEAQVKSDAETSQLRDPSTGVTVMICFPAPYTPGTPVLSGQRVTAKVSYDYHFLPAMISWVGLPTTKALTASATMYLEQNYDPASSPPPRYTAVECP